MRTQTSALFITLLFSSIITGCASTYIDAGGRLHFAPPKSQMELLIEREPCCKHFWEITYEKIELDKPYDYEINNILPAYEFDSGKSYVIGLEIPTYYKSIKLEIDSYFDNNLFYPNITILDDRYYVIKSVSHKSIKYENTKKFSSAYLSGYFDINETEDTAKYILIYTTDELQKYRLIVNPGSRAGYDMHAGPEGKIRINLKSN